MIVRLPNGAMRTIDPYQIIATSWADDGSIVTLTLATVDGEKIVLRGKGAEDALEQQRAAWQAKDAPI